MKLTKWRSGLAYLLWAELFIAIPSWLGYVVWHGIAYSPGYLGFLLHGGDLAFTLGLTLPQVPFQLVGALIGYSAGVVISCRLFGKDHFSAWVLEEGKREIRFFNPFYKFTRYLLNQISN